MGHTFYDVTMPALVEALERLNQNLERLAPTSAHNAPTAAPSPPVPPNPARDG